MSVGSPCRPARPYRSPGVHAGASLAGNESRLASARCPRVVLAEQVGGSRPEPSDVLALRLAALQMNAASGCRGLTSGMLCSNAAMPLAAGAFPEEYALGVVLPR